MIVIFGAGRQGECLIYALKKLGHDIFVVDQLISDNVKQMVGKNWANVDLQSNKDIEYIFSDSLYINPKKQKIDLAISCLPYFLNFKVAKTCIDNKIAYFDLGGHIETNKKINDYAVEYYGQVFTDLGLAPGWVNILAEECYSRASKIDKVTDVNMFCGGLPIIKFNPPFNYMSTWSIEGLINEYKDDCLILKDYIKTKVKGMTGLDTAFYEEYECFNTSGGIGRTLDLMYSREVKNCSYRTVRYKGHRDIVYPLLNLLSEDMFEKLFKCPTHMQDKVIIGAEAFGKNGHYHIKHEIIGDDKFTAMQKCTAFPVASIAHMFINGHDALEVDYNSFDYSHVSYDEFSLILGDLLGTKL